MRWVVAHGDGSTVGDVLARAGADPRALQEGRVFVGRRRVRASNDAVHPGDLVDVAPPVPDASRPDILEIRGDLVAVAKPAGIPTIPDHGGEAHALVALVAKELGVDPVRVHPTSRLDRDVSGVVVFATSKAAISRLAEARTRGDYERRYVAIATRAPEPPGGTWVAPIGRARDPRLRAANGRDAVAAETQYATVLAIAGGAVMALRPVTGRTHQLRVHAAAAKAPLIGDRAYGGPTRLTLGDGRVLSLQRVMLHAARVTVPDASGRPFTVRAAIPEAMRETWAALGGSPEAWDLAVACSVPSSSPPSP